MTTLPTGVRLHKSGRFIADITVSGQRYTQTFNTMREAARWREQVKAVGFIASTEKKAKQDGLWSVKQAYQYANQTVWEGKASQETCNFNYRSIETFFSPSKLMKDIKKKDVDAFVKYLQDRGDSASTINKKISVLSVMFKVAEEQEGLGDVTPPRMPRMKRTETRIRFLSPKEEHDLLYNMELYGYKEQADACKCLIYTGFRCSELWKLEVRDVDFDHKVIVTWETKSGKSRAVPLLPAIEDILKARCEGKNDDEKIFPDGSNPWLRNAWELVRNVMGKDDDAGFTPHMLRHTCATRLSQQGVSLPVIKNWLGHASIQTTIRYAHFNQHDMLEAGRLLDLTSTK